MLLMRRNQAICKFRIINSTYTVLEEVYLEKLLIKLAGKAYKDNVNSGIYGFLERRCELSEFKDFHEKVLSQVHLLQYESMSILLPIIKYTHFYLPSDGFWVKDENSKITWKRMKALLQTYTFTSISLENGNRFSSPYRVMNDVANEFSNYLNDVKLKSITVIHCHEKFNSRYVRELIDGNNSLFLILFDKNRRPKLGENFTSINRKFEHNSKITSFAFLDNTIGRKFEKFFEDRKHSSIINERNLFLYDKRTKTEEAS